MLAAEMDKCRYAKDTINIWGENVQTQKSIQPQTSKPNPNCKTSFIASIYENTVFIKCAELYLITGILIF